MKDTAGEGKAKHGPLFLLTGGEQEVDEEKGNKKDQVGGGGGRRVRGLLADGNEDEEQDEHGRGGRGRDVGRGVRSPARADVGRGGVRGWTMDVDVNLANGGRDEGGEHHHEQNHDDAEAKQDHDEFFFVGSGYASDSITYYSSSGGSADAWVGGGVDRGRFPGLLGSAYYYPDHSGASPYVKEKNVVGVSKYVGGFNVTEGEAVEAVRRRGLGAGRHGRGQGPGPVRANDRNMRFGVPGRASLSESLCQECAVWLKVGAKERACACGRWEG